MTYLKTSLLALGLGLATSLSAQALTVELGDPAWDGQQIPAGMQCQKFGGDGPRSPALMVSDMPEGTNLLMFEYSDRSFAPMDNGGHGRFGLAINQPVNKLWVSHVPGHSFDLPQGFFLIEPHRNPSWDTAGAYMPPCSGGRNNEYYVTVSAVKFDGEKLDKLATQVLELGRY